MLRAGCSTISIDYTRMMQGLEVCEVSDCSILQSYELPDLCRACGEAGRLHSVSLLRVYSGRRAAQLPRPSVVSRLDHLVSSVSSDNSNHQWPSLGLKSRADYWPAANKSCLALVVRDYSLYPGTVQLSTATTAKHKKYSYSSWGIVIKDV